MEARRTSRRIAVAVVVTGISMAIDVAPAPAQPLTKAQQKCVNGLNKDFAKIDAAVAKQISACIKNHAKGKELNQDDPGIDTLEECVLDDPKGKIQKAEDKAVQNFDKLCAGQDKGGADKLPAWAATDAAVVSMAGRMKTVDLAAEVFGSPLDPGVLVTEAANKAASKCQQAVWKAVTGCEATKVEEFLGCKKLAFKEGSVASAAELEAACLMQGGAPSTGQPDDEGKIAKACAGSDGGIGKVIAKKCAGADLDALFPGCAGADYAACLDREVACQVCLALNAADALARDCDLFDDGQANATCGDADPTPTPVPTATPTATPTPVPTATPVPTPIPTPTAPPPGCTTATVRTVVSFDGNEATGAVATVGYGNEVSIPGTGSQSQVAARVTKLNPANGIFSVGDSDSQPPFQLNIGLVAIPGPVPAGDFADVEFDCESGTPMLGDFTCSASVSDLLGFPIESTCTLSLQLD